MWLCYLHIVIKFLHCNLTVITPRKKISGSWTLDHNSSLQKEPNNKKKQSTLPYSSSSSSSLKQSQPLSKARQNSSSSEDDAYILLHPSGTSASALYTGDSGFEDVRPLQRLDQEMENDGGESSEPDSKFAIVVVPSSSISGTVPYIYYCQFCTSDPCQLNQRLCVYEWEGGTINREQWR